MGKVGAQQALHGALQVVKHRLPGMRLCLCCEFRPSLIGPTEASCWPLHVESFEPSVDCAINDRIKGLNVHQL